MEDTTPEPKAAQEAAEGQQDEPTKFDSDYVSKLRAENAKYRTEAKANADAAARLAEIENAQKTEAQRAQEALAAAQTEAANARAEALRYRVGVAAGLPPEVISRLQGSTEEELAADAKNLAELFKPASPATPPGATRPVSTLASGAVPPDQQEPADLNEWLRRSLSNQ